MSTFNELIDFTRSTTGTYLDSVVYGDELVVNNAFNDATGWYESRNSSTISAVSNKLRSTADSAATFGGATTLAGLTVGKQYKIQGTASSNNSSKAIVRMRVSIAQDLGSDYITIGQTLGSVTVNTYFIATAETMYVGTIVTGHDGGDYVEFDSGFSVKEIIGGQVSAGTPLLRTAAINEPRLEYDASGNPLGLLIEEGRTNLVLNSVDASSDNSATNSTQTANKANSLTGADDAFLLQANTTGASYTGQATSVTSGTNYTASRFAKAGASNFAQLSMGTGGFGSQVFANFDLSTGTVSQESNCVAVMTSMGSGWYRCSVSKQAVTTTSATSPHYFSAVDSGTATVRTSEIGNSVYFYGAQTETGSFPTSYIPTSGSTVARTKDLALLPVERFAYNQSKGSIVFYADMFSQSQDTTPRLYEFSDGSNDNAIRLYSPPVVDRLTADVRSGGVSVFADNLVSPDFNEPFKIFQAYKVNDFSVGFNGKLEQNDTSGAVPIGIAKINLFSKHSGSNVNNGHIKQIQYYPKRLSNEELELLTQPSASPTMNLTFDGQATSTLVEGFHD